MCFMNHCLNFCAKFINIIIYEVFMLGKAFNMSEMKVNSIYNST